MGKPYKLFFNKPQTFNLMCDHRVLHNNNNSKCLKGVTINTTIIYYEKTYLL